MKKLAALIMTLVLALMCTAAFADADLVWEGEAAEKAAAIEGEFRTFEEISVKIWIPAVLAETELSDEDRANGFIGYFAAEDGAPAVGIQYINMDGTSLEDYQALLAGEGIEGIEAGTVNGIPALSYEYEGNGVIAFATEMGYILEVAGGPIGTEDFQTLIALIMSSIQSA